MSTNVNDPISRLLDHQEELVQAKNNLREITDYYNIYKYNSNPVGLYHAEIRNGSILYVLDQLSGMGIPLDRTYIAQINKDKIQIKVESKKQIANEKKEELIQRINSLNINIKMLTEEIANAYRSDKGEVIRDPGAEGLYNCYKMTDIKQK